MNPRLRLKLASAFLILEAMRAGMRPDPIEPIGEWAAAHRILSGEASAEAGRWRNERTPYLNEIMDALSPSSPIERVVFMKGAQIGGTEVGNNFVAYCVAKGLGPTMVVQPTVDLAKTYSKQRLDPLFRDTAVLFEKVGPRSQSNERNQLLHKTYVGGQLVLRGSEAAAGLRSMPIRNLFMDEIDAYPLDAEGEGDPCELAFRRTATYSRRKVLEVSTPTDEHSRVHERFMATDQRYYHVPCPHCDAYQKLVYKRISFDRDEEGYLIPDSVAYSCVGCGALIPEHHKTEMLARGKWIPEARSKNPAVRGYHLSSLYSPLGWTSWAEVVEKHLAAERLPYKLKTWINTYLGERFTEDGDAPDWYALWKRREPYDSSELPEGVRVLTAGVDIQPDRIEMEVVGWGPNLESWSIEYVVIPTPTNKPESWEELASYLGKTWKHANGGELALRRMAVDSGYNPQGVHAWAHPQIPRVLPVKGRVGDQVAYRPVVANVRKKNKRIRIKGMLWPVGVNTVKSELYGYLRLPEPAEGKRPERGYCHFPRNAEEEYFKQLTAEKRKIKRGKSGVPTTEWEVIPDRRNEALDCRVYARAAAYVEGIDGWSPEKWEAMRLETLAPEDRVVPTRATSTKPKRQSYIKGGKHPWLGGQ